MSRRPPAAWWFLAPALAAITLFFLVPVLAALLLSLTDFDIYAIGDPATVRFTGLRNYRLLLADDSFWTALRNTLVFVGIGGPLSLAVSLGGALLVDAPAVRLRGFFRTVYFLPVVTTLVAVAVVWRALYHPRVAPLAALFEALGLPAVDWLGDPRFAMPAIIVMAVWKNFGFNLVIFLAGLQAIPERLYEAARIDGAGSWQQLRHVTLPMLAPTFLFVSISTAIGYFQLFAEPYVMTHGGPSDATLSIVLLMYREGFRWWNLGYAAAVAFVLFLLILAASALQLRLRRGEWLGGRRERRLARGARGVTLHVALAVLAAAALLPLWWMVAASLMPPGEASSAGLRLWPSRPTLEHYRALFTELHLARQLANSALLATAVTAISLAVNTVAGYAFAKLRFRGREPLFRSLLAAMVIPGQVAMLPLFLLLEALGLVNTFAGVIVPGIASIFAIFLVRQSALAIPDSLLDAARVDGAGEARVLWSIALPALRPVLATLAVFTFLGSWNDFLWPLIVLSDDRLQTLPVALANLAGEHVQDTELMMAGAVLTVLPVVVLFVVLQRQYLAGLLAGAVKE